MDDDLYEIDGRVTSPHWMPFETIEVGEARQTQEWTPDSSTGRYQTRPITDTLPIFEHEEFLKILEGFQPETVPEFETTITEQDSNFESKSTSLQAEVTDFNVVPGDCTIPDTTRNDKSPQWYVNKKNPGSASGSPPFGKWLSLKSVINQPSATHLLAGRDGLLTTSLRFRNVEFIVDAQYFIRSVLHHVQRPFTAEPINQVCPVHVKKYGLNDSEASQLLQAGQGHGPEYFYTDKGARPSLMLAVDPPNEQGEVEAEKRFHCLCTSTCLSVTVGGQQKESSRDLALVQTLEAKLPTGEMVVLARATNSIWPKADICRRDYVKEERWEAKGGANKKQMEGKKRKKLARGCPVGKKIKSEDIIETVIKVEEDIPVFTVVEVTWPTLVQALRQKIANGECSTQEVLNSISE